MFVRWITVCTELYIIWLDRDEKSEMERCGEWISDEFLVADYLDIQQIIIIIIIASEVNSNWNTDENCQYQVRIEENFQVELEIYVFQMKNIEKRRERI